MRRLRRYRLLLFCLLISLLVHFGAVQFIPAFRYKTQKTSTQPIEVISEVRSSALRLEHRPRPQPARPNNPPPQPPQPQRQRQQQQQPIVPPQQPREQHVARIEPHALHVAVPQQHNAQSMNFAQQEQSFERTIAQLRRQNDPVVSAARPVSTPAAPKAFTYNFSGSMSTLHAEGILSPVKSWRDGPYDYYYVQYWVQYADGSTETGYVPWPIRYLPGDDPFRLHYEHFPLPAPLPDFQLPAGTDLHPLVAYCLEHRSELSDCPIAHD